MVEKTSFSIGVRIVIVVKTVAVWGEIRLNPEYSKNNWGFIG